MNSEFFFLCTNISLSNSKAMYQQKLLDSDNNVHLQHLSMILKNDLDSSLLSKACSGGTYGKKGQCLPCPMGQYNDGSKQWCSFCSPGSYNAHTGSSSCHPCPAGTYNRIYGQTVPGKTTKLRGSIAVAIFRLY